MKRSIYDWVLEILTLSCLIWSFYPLCFYDKLAGADSIHYNSPGQVDAWGNRSFFWLLPSLSLCLYVGISILEKYYSKLNYPVKVTEYNANSLYKLALGLLRHTKFLTVLLFAYINNATLSVALSKGGGLNGYIVTALTAGLLAVVFAYSIRMMKFKK